MKKRKSVKGVLACNKDASIGAIFLLLDADESKRLVSKKSLCDRLPLHLAIRKKLPVEIIKLLLDSGSDKDIHKECEGMRRNDSTSYCMLEQLES